MELKTTAGLITKLGSIERFVINVDSHHYVKARKKLEAEREKCLVILRELKQKGKIKSVSLPKNKTIQKELDELVQFKEDITESIEKIKEIFCR